MEAVKLEEFPGKRHRLRAGFYPTRSLRHTIQKRFGTVTIRIAETFRSVPEDILRLLGHILLAKLYGQKIDGMLRRRYHAFVEEHILPGHPVRRRISDRYTSRGSVYNLEERFDVLNRVYFDNRLTKPRIGWSLNRSYRRLGFFAAERNLLVISRIFDSARVPADVLDFLLYHEMLHIHYPAERKNGRNRIHTREFRKSERSYPGYERIERWLKKNISSL